MNKQVEQLIDAYHEDKSCYLSALFPNTKWDDFVLQVKDCLHEDFEITLTPTTRTFQFKNEPITFSDVEIKIVKKV